ncbi:M48 family metallopeptidase [Clostridium sp.]|uniref:M48 family metallopeptidase n=1 Tax=Clostridium sp. TaxID=1506 RepID=UPI0026269920|nr:SprT family zinc-dependent metalloprotease [Clostridium sp.]
MKYKFEYENNEIEFNIIRRKRKTICIKIEEGGEVVVIAPLKTSREYILLVVKNKAQWILEKKKEVKERGYIKVKRDFTPGSTFMYLGEEYPFELIYNEKKKKISIELINELSCDYDKNISANKNIKIESSRQESLFNKNTFIIITNTLDEGKLKEALEKWYRTKTLEIVQKRIDYYSNNFKDRVTAIRVKEQKRRWASCTGKNVILFNWRISMARADVLDYIVVHEMCHMDHRNHSKYFWNRVGEIMPDYKVKHEWLKKNGMNLYL